MASRSRGHKIKSQISKGGILNRIPTASMVKPKWEPLFNEILYAMEFRELPPHKQIVGIMFARTFCQIAELWDCRGVIKETDYQEKIIALNDLDSLVTLLLKLFDKLNASTNSGKEKKPEATKEPTINMGEALQQLLANGNRPTTTN